jgi:16S rRNA (cytosine1402-N4)-methyltransferase
MNGRAELHVPVMLAEVVGLLAPALEPPPTDSAGDDCAFGSCSRNAHARGSPYLVDCTLGLGGHAHALLAACPEAQLIGLDRDPQALALAGERLAEFADRVTLVEAVYDELPAVLARLSRPKVQGILLDLGISSLQIDDPERGFAYAQDAPLDMRMGRQALTAAEVLNTYSRAELSRILRSNCSPDSR